MSGAPLSRRAHRRQRSRLGPRVDLTETDTRTAAEIHRKGADRWQRGRVGPECGGDRDQRGKLVAAIGADPIGCTCAKTRRSRDENGRDRHPKYS